jgi:hypothetical protein
MIAIVNATPKAIADPIDVSQIQFTRYSDSDFNMDYPSTWHVSRSTYNAYNCISNQGMKCYQNEIKTIGPFDFKTSSRIVSFTSADGKQKIVAFTSDFGDSMTGYYTINPILEWAKNRVTENYPDVADTAVGDYQYNKMGGNSNIMQVSYSVTLPVGSAAYPLAYKMKDFVTSHHLYEFAYISDNENIQKYRNLEERILSSITPNDMQ